MSLICRQIEDYNVIRRIRKNSYDENTFCTDRWDSFLQNAFNARRHFVGIYDNEELIGFWPAYVIKKGPLKIIGSPLRGWFTPWLGPRFFQQVAEDDIKSISQSAMHAFDEYVAKNHFDYVECSSLNFDDEIMRNLNYKSVNKATAILDISLPLDDLLKSFGKTCRKRIIKAEKYGCTVNDISSINFIPQLWDMTVDVFGRRGSGPAHNHRIIKKLIETHLSSGHLFCLGVFKDNELISIGVHAWHEKYLVDLFRATYVRYYNYYPYHILYWDLFQRAKKKGCKYFDMMGVDNRKPDQFKMSFHPELITWNHWVKSRTIVARIGSFIYQVYVNKVVRNLARLGIEKG